MRTSRVGVRAVPEQGFTLVELVMVILVLGIFMAVTVPRLGGVFENRELRRSINALRGYVRYLHAQAAFTKQYYLLTFDLERQTIYSCASSDGRTCRPDQGRALPDYEFRATVYLLDVVSPGGQKIVEGLVTTRFRPTGVAEPSLIHLGTSSGQRATLVIEPLSGRLKDFEGYVDRERG